MVDTHSKKKGEEQEEVATLTLAKNNNEQELIAGRQGECTLWQSESESESELESPSQSFAYMCLRRRLHLCLSSLRSCAFSAVFLFPISFSIYSVLISVLILRRKLLQRPEIVYQNDKMELSSGAGAGAGANVFGNISPWLVGLQIDLAAGCRT